MEDSAPVQRLPLAAGATRARLTLYPPRLRQRTHVHEAPHVSIIVAGSVREVGAGRDEIGYALQLHLRPYEARHRVEFGPHGALILAVDVEHAATRATASGWLHRDLSSVQRRLVRCVLAEGVGRGTDIDECILDLLAGIESEPLRGSPPRWLLQARERLTDDPANARIDALARAAGVHRAHFARAFHHWFRISPSLFRRHEMLSQAIAAMASGQSLALAANTAGFADQSHLCRTVRSLTGATPCQLLHRAGWESPVANVLTPRRSK